MPTETHINEIALQNQVKCICIELKLRYKGLFSGQWDNDWMLHKPKYKLLKWSKNIKNSCQAICDLQTTVDVRM